LDLGWWCGGTLEKGTWVWLIGRPWGGGKQKNTRREVATQKCLQAKPKSRVCPHNLYRSTEGFKRGNRRGHAKSTLLLGENKKQGGRPPGRRHHSTIPWAVSGEKGQPLREWGGKQKSIESQLYPPTSKEFRRGGLCRAMLACDIRD